MALQGYPKPPRLRIGPLSNRDIARVVERDGLGVAILDVIYEDDIQDPHLRRQWAAAATMLALIKSHLEAGGR